MDYDAKFGKLFADLQADPSALQAFITNPQPVLEAAGIPLVESMAGAVATSQGPTLAAAATAPDYQLRVETQWWGVDFILNEELTQAIINGRILEQAIADLLASGLDVIGIIARPLAVVIAAAFSAVMVSKIIPVKLADKGKGVHWPITWLQWAGVIAAAPGGPGAVALAMQAFIYPFPN